MNLPPESEWEEAAFRAGLLSAAFVFFVEACGSPIQRGIHGIVAAVLSLLVVLTMAFQWRVLGDWRRAPNQLLLILLAATLVTPIAAVLNPSIGGSILPDAVRIAIEESLGFMAKIPGMQTIGALIQGMITFAFVVITMMVLAFGSGRGRGTGLMVLAGVSGLALLALYPGAEIFAALIFLGAFLRTQWEVPLIIPPKVLESLDTTERQYLRELLRLGAVNTGETRLYLENRPDRFARLLDLQLVQYDPIAREVVEGPRLAHDPAAAFMETAFGVVRRGGWIALGLLYFVLPDFLPGPIDDFIVLALSAGTGLNILGGLFSSRRSIARR